MLITLTNQPAFFKLFTEINFKFVHGSTLTVLFVPEKLFCRKTFDLIFSAPLARQRKLFLPVPNAMQNVQILWELREMWTLLTFN